MFTSEQLGIGATVLRHALDLVAAPYALYTNSGPEVRRHLNETFYQRFYIDDPDDTAAPRVDSELTSIFADLHQTARSCDQSHSHYTKGESKLKNKRPVAGSNKPIMVVLAGFEPATSRV